MCSPQDTSTAKHQQMTACRMASGLCDRAARRNPMRALLGTTLGVIAVGVMLIAYGLLNPRSVATAPTFADGRADGFQLARPASERVVLGDEGNLAATPQMQLRCEPGQRAVIGQIDGRTAAECVDAAVVARYGSVRTPVSYGV